MIRALLERLTARMQPRVIMDREGHAPYLSRYYLLGAPRMADGSSPFTAEGDLKPDVITAKGMGLYLHKFHKSDDDGALHNHPFQFAFSFILAGGYQEERRYHDFVYRRTVKPGRLIRVLPDDFHRVDLLEHDSWSLFLVGPKTKSWGFWNRETKEYLPWRDFIASIRGPGWDDPGAHVYRFGEFQTLAKTAFAAREWFAHACGIADRQSIRVERVERDGSSNVVAGMLGTYPKSSWTTGKSTVVHDPIELLRQRVGW